MLFAVLVSCSPKLQQQYSKSVDCVTFDQDGTQVLSVWCGGKNNFVTCDEAVSRAIEQVLFVGITSGQSKCTSIPLVLNQNARQDYGKYFEDFLSPKGDHTKFATLEAFRSPNLGFQANPHQIFVRVFHRKLVAHLVADSIKIN
jgi:hypothetical protein